MEIIWRRFYITYKIINFPYLVFLLILLPHLFFPDMPPNKGQRSYSPLDLPLNSSQGQTTLRGLLQSALFTRGQEVVFLVPPQETGGPWAGVSGRAGRGRTGHWAGDGIPGTGGENPCPIDSLSSTLRASSLVLNSCLRISQNGWQK